MPIPKKQEQWNAAIEKAREAIQDLIDIQEECQEKYDEMGEKAQEGERGEALSKICDVDLQAAMDAMDDASDCEMP